jgi:hypothetical protein
VFYENLCSSAIGNTLQKYNLKRAWMDCWEYSCRQQCVEWSYCDVLPLNVSAELPSQLSKNISDTTEEYRRTEKILAAHVKANLSAPSDLTAAAYYETAKQFEGEIELLVKQALSLRNTQTLLKERLRSIEYQYEQGNASLIQHLTQELHDRDSFWTEHSKVYSLALETSAKSISKYRAQLVSDLQLLDSTEALLAAMLAENSAFDSQYRAVMAYLNQLLDEIDQIEVSLMDMWFELELLDVAETEILAFLQKLTKQVKEGNIQISCGQDAIVRAASSTV